MKSEIKGASATTSDAADEARVLHSAAAVGSRPEFIDWTHRLYGAEVLHAQDLQGALRIVHQHRVNIVLIDLDCDSPPAAEIVERLASGLHGVPLVGVLSQRPELNRSSVVELQIAGMAGYVSTEADGARTARLLRSFAGRGDAVQLERERHRRAVRQLADFENWSARFTKGLDQWVHDLRTPLGIIHGFAGNLLDDVYGTVDERQRDVLSKIKGATEILSGLVEQVRSDLPSPPELDDDMRPQQAVGRTQVNLEKICEEAVDFLATAADASGIRMSLTKETCPLVWGNRVRIIQALVNLLKNACRFTPSGGTIDVGVSPLAPTEDEPWARCQLVVEDSGPGLPAGQEERILEPGFTTHGEKGHQGMGLAVVSEVVKEHGGRVQAGNAASGGACFRLVLPVDPRRRRRQTKVHLLTDPGFVRSLVTDLERSGADVETVAGSPRLEELGKQLRAGGQEIFVLDPDGSLGSGRGAGDAEDPAEDKEA